MLDEQGSRHMIYPADVRGKWTRRKPIVQIALIAIYVALPFITINGHPAVWIDIARRHFYLFGTTFNAQDFYLAFFGVSGIGFALIVMAGLFGRIWCGWACPQTVFLDGVFRRVERWIEGPAQERKRLANAPMSSSKFFRKGLKHLFYLLLSTAIAHIFLAYFASPAALGKMITEGPGEHPATFTWAVALTAVSYGNFWWFREQLCIVICPYGRLQSVLQDQDTINIIYDSTRGEPRGKAKDKATKNLGDCVDCGRCVAVCPTGIDIRQGHQLECVGCAACIDACDEIMVKLARPVGLIRYDSLRSVESGTRRFWRPRVFFYGFMGMLGLAVATFVILKSDPFEAELLRVGVPFTIQNGVLDNSARVHVVNKQPATSTFTIKCEPPEDKYVSTPQPEVTLEPFGDHDLPILIHVPAAEYHRGIVIRGTVTSSFDGAVMPITVEVLGPNRLVVP